MLFGSESGSSRASFLRPDSPCRSVPIFETKEPRGQPNLMLRHRCPFCPNGVYQGSAGMARITCTDDNFTFHTHYMHAQCYHTERSRCAPRIKTFPCLVPSCVANNTNATEDSWLQIRVRNQIDDASVLNRNGSHSRESPLRQSDALPDPEYSYVSSTRTGTSQAQISVQEESGTEQTLEEVEEIDPSELEQAQNPDSGISVIEVEDD